MIRRLVFCLALLTLLALVALTWPRFVKTEYYVIDSISDGVVRLEPLGDTGKDASWLEHGCLYLEHQDNLVLAEGQVVACFTFGNKLLGIAPDMAKTERRRAEIQAIIWRINPNAPASD
ncbi:MAG: hypothetical protein GX228_08820 [Firmicutes bacterium]|nr:hypothetical protein [Bacillota bacterium]NLL89010.1 hypothetical protein [Bacillota bacterium]HKM17544.1 hypothetical protein [Limnochordia bacterium]